MSQPVTIAQPVTVILAAQDGEEIGAGGVQRIAPHRHLSPPAAAAEIDWRFALTSVWCIGAVALADHRQHERQPVGIRVDRRLPQHQRLALPGLRWIIERAGHQRRSAMRRGKSRSRRGAARLSRHCRDSAGAGML